MKDPILKRIEIWFRRFLIQFLGLFIHRKNVIQSPMNFNTCKFLFIRQDRIGDVLISTPLFVVLKKHYPQATIDFLLSKNNHFVLEHDPLIRLRWIYTKKLKEIFNLIRLLRKEQYDFVVDLMDNPSVTSTVLCLLVKAKWNVGIDKENNFMYDIRVPLLSRSDTHIVDRIAQLMNPFNIHPQEEQLAIRYFTSASSDEFVEKVMKQKGLSTVPMIGVNISAGTETRFWGVENFKQLLLFIENVHPEFKSIVLYQPSDEARAKLIAQSNRNTILSPVTASFDQFAAFVKRLSILITPDTSAVHLASAFKIPAVVLYVQSNKSLRVWEPYRVDSECLVTEVDDLSTIPNIKVQNALNRLVQRTQKKGRSERI